jgi:LuxR family maltose regulon positive regulatory protein
MRRVLNHLVIDKRTGHVLDPARAGEPGRLGVVGRCGLFERLGRAGRVTVVSAPAGSGKTVLLRSWIGAAGLAGRAGWVRVQGQERDPRRFWVSVAGALRDAAGAARVRPVPAAPDLDGWAIAGRLLEDLGRLPERVWLVIDDVHELRSAEALRQLELLVLRAPPELRFLLATRQDLRLGLHGLRLEGELTEIRAADLGFTLEEARALLDGAGVRLPEWALALLVERTEGWAAGLRLAAQSLAGHPDPERAAAEFCGSERTVADYLVAEVLERLDEQARRLLLRTSVLEWVPGALADVLTGSPGAERILQDLEQAGAFVVSLNMRRSVFRYHRLFAELLQLELRRTEPALIPELHTAAAGWFADHGHPVEAIRHAQAAQDWNRAARLLSDQWLRLVLGGQGGIAREFLARFPAGFAADPELAALRGADELDGESLERAARYLMLAGHRSASVPEERRESMITQGPGVRGASSPRGTAPSVSDAEIRVLRYLPSDLTVPEIARQLSLSVNTVRTHMRHIYDKLHTHHRRDVVERASALGLLSRR